ncbi:putative negative regulation of gluconeogenesis protein [Zymoseptoria brevis]|uniref:Putative negative regulation of gluconeogenesis protein n=1 Tax=Zymoseptoria brevis TaxID=1047168 RepID=A0A0F4GDB7_9PEZI|nr:putative negative regulation of gluconeogenesis protein [Zymoseptoria brevis]
MELEHDTHLLLDQPLLRLPHELLRKNLKAAQRHVDQGSKNVTKDVQSAGSESTNGNDTLAALEAALTKAQTLKRRLEQLHAEEQTIQGQQRKRIEHLEQLHQTSSLADVKYDRWAHTRLDRLLVDYLLRHGYSQTARDLASEKDITDLVDVDVFDECRRIEQSLLLRRTTDCLAWCADHKQALKKTNSTLELELRLQQVVELARHGDMKTKVDAMLHARKHLVAGQDIEFGLRAGGLLAHDPDTLVEPYRMMYSPERYTHLARQFVKTHHELFALPSQPLLHIALSAGLSALKTPSCHSQYALQANANTGAPVCPICSTELNELARSVPYAHHTKSHMEDDPVVLPNGRVYGRERLKRLNDKLGTTRGKIRDPTDLENEWDEEDVRKVYIS